MSEYNQDHDRGRQRSWVFQANPKRYRIESALQNRKEINWLVNQHKKDIHVDDKVYIWKCGAHACILAIAKVNLGPTMLPSDDPENDIDIPRGLACRVRLEITDNLLCKPIYKEVLKNHPKLKNLSILRSWRGTNFKVEDDEERALSKLIG